MSSQHFDLLTLACMGGNLDEFRIKLIYVGISLFSIVCVLLVLGRILYRHRRKMASTSIGRLVERLVCVQGLCDILFHGLDLIFALDCAAPPLLFLLTVHRDEIYTARTITYNIVKEGFGLLSLAWHAHVARCLYRWIVLKHSAVRLQRRRLPFLALAAAAVTGIRIALYQTLRENHTGLYLSIMIYSVILVPGIIFVCLRWYFLTATALTNIVRGNGADLVHDDSLMQRHVSLEMSRIRGQGGAGGGGDGSGRRGSGSGGSGQGAAGGSRGAMTTTRVSAASSSFGSDATARRSGATATPEREGGGGAGGQEEEAREGLQKGDSVNIPRQPPLLPVTTTIMSYPGSSHHGSRREGTRNASIVRRLLRISFSVAVVWSMIAILDIYLWTFFYLKKETKAPLRGVFLTRMVFMRAVGTVDAVMLGDLFVICVPCAQAIVRFFKRFTSGKTSSPPTRAPAASSMVSVGKMHLRSLGIGGGRESSVIGNGTRSSAAGGNDRKSQDEEEAARIVQTLDSTHRRRYPARRVKSLEIFACTWNMGGCSIHYTKEVVKQRLEVLLPQWLPPAYSLYVLGVQESGCLQLFRETVHAYLGGPEAYTMFGDELGDDTILHGFIAVTLFVKTSDVAEGVFRVYKGAQNKVAAGMNLGVMGHAANKGMVGLSCRYYDATLAIITAHFASDSKGRNRLAKRNLHACKTLQDMSLSYDSEGFAVNLAFRHTIVLGDFNYRCSPASPKDVLRLLSRSARQMQQAHIAAATRSPLSPVGLEVEEEGEGQLSSVAAAAAAAAGATWRQASYARFFQSPSDFLFTVGNMPELPPCLGTRLTSASSNLSSLGGVVGGSLSGFGRSKSYLSQGGGGSTMPRLGESFSNLSLFRLKSTTDSSVGGGGSKNSLVLGEDGTSTSGNVAVPVKHETISRASSLRREVSATATSVSDIREGDENEEEDEEIYPAGAGAGAGAGAVPGHVLPSFVNNDSSIVTMSTADVAADAWEWVKRLDELTRSMSERTVFHGFVEAPICFPMSYRWQRVLNADDDNDQQGGLAGDYTSLTRLMERAYSTFVADQGKPFLPSLSFSARFPSMMSPGTAGEGGASGGGSPTLCASSPKFSSIGGDGGGSSGDNNNKGIATSARTPSYTDRILTHSLPGKASSLRWRHYDMADAVGLSDHRPVCAHLTLLVDPDCRGFRTSGPRPPFSPSPSLGTGLRMEGGGQQQQQQQQQQQSSFRLQTQEGGSGGGGGGAGDAADEDMPLPPEESDIVRFQIVLSHPRLSLKGGSSRFLTTALSGAIGTAPQEATILFPLMAEDPLAAARKASSLEAVMPGAGPLGGSKSDPLLEGKSAASSLSFFPWSAFPLQIKTVASLRFSEHLLLKISNGKGQEIGEAVIPVALGLKGEEEEGPAAAASDGGGAAATKTTTENAGAARQEEIVKDHTAAVARTERRFRFPLTLGGALKGYISLSITTRVKPVQSKSTKSFRM